MSDHDIDRAKFVADALARLDTQKPPPSAEYRRLFGDLAGATYAADHAQERLADVQRRLAFAEAPEKLGLAMSLEDAEAEYDRAVTAVNAASSSSDRQGRRDRGEPEWLERYGAIDLSEI